MIKLHILMKKTVGLLSPPTVFMVFGLPCAGMEIDCQRGLEKTFAENRQPRVCGKGTVRFADGK